MISYRPAQDCDPIMTPDQYCDDRAARSGSSFYYSFLFLPPEQRRAITALYAFCREVDDVVDECSDNALAQTKLEWWRGEIAALFAGSPQHPVTLALQPVTARHNLPQEYFQEIIDGMAMDLQQVRYASFKELQLYCYRVASVVGMMAAEIFGYEDRRTLKYAHDLGIAFQLTNILRDVGEDAARGRIYLPADEMERFEVSNDDILQHRGSDGVYGLFRFQAGPAREMNPCFRHNEVHGYIVRLRVDGRHSGQFERHADLERLWRHASERAVEIAATVTKSVTAQIKSDRRNKQRLRSQHVGSLRYGEVKNAS